LLSCKFYVEIKAEDAAVTKTRDYSIHVFVRLCVMQYYTQLAFTKSILVWSNNSLMYRQPAQQ
jgi:hypothetical protein